MEASPLAQAGTIGKETAVRKGLVFLLVVLVQLAAGASPLKVMLDFLPNPNHIPLYAAQVQGFFSEEGIEVEIMPPADPSDPAKLAAARVVDLALTPQMNYLIAKAAGLSLISVGALIDGALGGLLSLADFGIEELSDLRGRKVGYSLAPLEPVLWRTMLSTVGVKPGEFELVNVGMSTVPALLSGKVDAIGAFRNFELIKVELLGKKAVFFPQEDYGVPNTYEILIVANPELLQERAREVRGFLTALARGIAFTLERPEAAFGAFLSLYPDRDDELHRRSFAATLPLYAEGARHDDADRWAGMQDFLYQNGLVDRTFPLEELYTTEFLNPP